MPLFSGLRAKLLPLCGVLLLCGAARAATFTGNSNTGRDGSGNCVGITGNNSFDDPRNWGGACSPGTVPGPGETADIGGAGVAGTTVNVGTLQISGGSLTADSITTDNLNLSSGAVAGNSAGGSTLTVNNAVNWTGGHISSTTATFAPTCTATISGTNTGATITSEKIINGAAVLHNRGTINWSGDPISGFGGGSGTLDNQGTFNMLSDGSLGDSVSGYGITLVNSGLFAKTGGSGVTSIGAANGFRNNGGTLQAQTGVFDPSPAYSTTVFNGATIAAGNGAVRQSGGDWILSGNMTLNGTLQLTGGQSVGVATFSGPGQIDWQGGGFGAAYNDANGVYQDHSNITFASDLHANLSGAADKAFGPQSYPETGALTNKGTLTWSGPGNVSGEVKNQGTFNLLSDGALTGITIINTGTLAKTGGSGALTTGGHFLDNSGVIDVQSGSLVLNYNQYSHDIFRDKSVIQGAGRLVSTNFLFGEGTLAINGTLEIDGAYLYGGTLGGAGTLDWQGGSLDSVTIAPGFTLNASGDTSKGFSVGQTNSAPSTLAGVLNWRGGAPITFDGYKGPQLNTGTINLLAEGGFDGGKLTNQGTLNTFPGGTSIMSGTLLNSGVLNLGTASAPGTLSFNQTDFTNSGTVNLGIIGAGAGQFSRFTSPSNGNGVTNFYLGGTLNVNTASGFTPAASDTFPIISDLSRTNISGTFATVNGLNLSNGTRLKVSYNSDNVTLSVVQAPVLSVDSPSVMEGNSGTTPLPFTFTLSAASTEPVSFKYATGDASAKTGIDYTGKSETVTFAPGEVTKVVNIAILGDTTDESDETFGLNLSEAQGLTFARVQTIGTITDDDGQPSITIGDTKVNEDNQVNVSAIFTVRLSNPSSQTVTVKYATSDITAKAGLDYIAGSGTVSIPAGQLSKTFIVTVKGDTIDEPNETYQVKLTNPVAASISDDIAIGTIFDNDPVPSISVKAPSIAEGNSGTTNLNFELKLSNASDRTVTVQVHSFPAKTLPATAGVDYIAVPNTTVTFAPGEFRKIVPIVIKGDLLDEENERVGLELRSPVSATLEGTTTGVLDVEGTITDDDAPPVLSIGDISFQEGNSGTQQVRFTVTLSAPAGREVKVGYSTLAGTATAGSDFIAQSGQLTFAPGQTSQVITIGVVGDNLVEANENFKVVLSAAINALISRPNGLATILNDDTSAAAAPSGGGA